MMEPYIYLALTGAGRKSLAEDVAMGRDSDDIDQLIAELHASTGAAPRGAAVGDTGRLESWLRRLGDAGGSDLLLVAGAPP